MAMAVRMSVLRPSAVPRVVALHHRRMATSAAALPRAPGGATRDRPAVVEVQSASDVMRQTSGPYFARFAVYKGSAALQLGLIPPRWEELPKGGFALEKAGTFLLEMANAKAGAGAGDSKGGYGQRAYDWDNKQSFALGVGEAAELVDLNEGRRREIRAVHDPMKGAEGQGATMKSFSVSTLDAKDGGTPTFFFNLSVTEGGKQAFAAKVPVTQSEMTVLSTIVQAFIPRLLGLDRVMDMDAPPPPAGGAENAPF